MKQPKKTVMQLVVNDLHNPLKSHVFRIYRCGHVRYNQAINGSLFYSSFQPTRKGQGYYDRYQKIKSDGYNIVALSNRARAKA